MTKYLIVSADDFGFHKGINEGVAKAYTEGMITSVNLMATGEAFEDALRLIKKLKITQIGAHLTLTETCPSLEAGRVPTLAGNGNRFYRDHNIFFVNLLLKRIDLFQAYLELKNQLEQIKKAGAVITNLSSHEHIHMLPEVLDIFVRLAKEYGIPAVRCMRQESYPAPFSARRLFRKTVVSLFEKKMADILKRYGIAAADHLAGFLDAGNIREDNLLAILGGLGEGTTELVTHPGFLAAGTADRQRFYVNCETELAALTGGRVKKFIKDKDIKLITYGDFLKIKGV